MSDATDALKNAMRAADALEERRRPTADEAREASVVTRLGTIARPPDEDVQLEPDTEATKAIETAIMKKGPPSKPNDFSVSIYQVDGPDGPELRCKVEADIIIGMTKDVASMLITVHKSYFP